MWTCSGLVYHSGLTTYYQHYCTDSSGKLYKAKVYDSSLGNLVRPEAPYGPNEGWTVIDD